MVQVLPQEVERPGLGAQIGAGLGQGFGQGFQQGLGGALDQYFTQKKQQAESQRKQSALKQFFDSPEGKSMSPEERGIFTLSSLVPGMEGIGKQILENRRHEKENQEYMDVVNRFKGEQNPESPNQPGYSKGQLQMLSGSKNPQIKDFSQETLKDVREDEKYKRDLARDEQKFQREQEAKKSEREEKAKEIKNKETATKENIKAASERMLTLANERGAAFPHLGKIPKIFSAKQREIRSEMDTLTSTFESALMPIINKGNLAQPRFDYIIGLLPKSDDTIETIRGKLKALKRTLKTEIPGSEDIIPDIDELTKESKKDDFDLEKPPEANQHKGKTIEDDKGNKYRSDGTNWRKI
jgi:hypothetical protein